MSDYGKFYIDGKWVDPAIVHVINPATEEPIATISLGSSSDVDAAVQSAKTAFASYCGATREERLELLREVIDIYKAKSEQLAETITSEMGAPISLSRKAQVPAGLAHLLKASRVAATSAVLR